MKPRMPSAFPMIAIPAERSMIKPRRTGQTMIVDWGVPPRGQGFELPSEQAR